MAPAWHSLPHTKLPLTHRMTVAGLYVTDLDVIAWIYREEEQVYVGEVEVEGTPISKGGMIARGENGKPVTTTASIIDRDPPRTEPIDAAAAFLRAVERDVQTIYAEEAEEALREVEADWRAAA